MGDGSRIIRSKDNHNITSNQVLIAGCACLTWRVIRLTSCLPMKSLELPAILMPTRSLSMSCFSFASACRYMTAECEEHMRTLQVLKVY